MINPRNIRVWYHRHTDRARGIKSYRAGFDKPGWSKLSRRRFKTATEAVEYGDRVLARWQRLYSAADMLAAQPVPAEG